MSVNADPKSALFRFLQKHSGRPVTKTDVTWEIEKYDEGYQATLRLPIMGDEMEFIGELGASPKEAEKLAAQQALVSYDSEVKAAEAMPNRVEKKKGEGRLGLISPSGGLAGKSDDNAERLRRELERYKGRVHQLEQQLGHKGKGTMTKGPVGGMPFGKGKLAPAFGKGMAKGPPAPAFGKGKWGPQQNLHLGRLADKGGYKGAGLARPPMTSKLGLKSPVAPAEPARARSQLNTFLQRSLGRPITKEDVIIAYEKFDEGTIQATLSLPCQAEETFIGEVGNSEKEAAENAAQVALKHFESEIKALPPQENKKKRKAAGETAAPDPTNPPPSTPKSELNSVCMKILKRTMVKGEIVYNTEKDPDFGGGYKSTVTFEFLSTDSGNTFTGEEFSSKQEAEQSAAGVALEAILATPEHAQTLEDRANEPPKKRFKGKDKGKGKGDDDAA